MARISLIGLGCLLPVLALAACRGNASEEPPIHLQQNMDFQERGDPQERNDFFEDGRVMRPPVAGTVAYGYLKEDDHLWKGRLPSGQLADALPAGMELTPALLDRGQQRYNIYCQPCHGELGYGDGPVTRRGGGFPVKPANLHLKRLEPAPLGYIFHVASEGYSTMLGYKAQVPTHDRWAIAAWVRTLQVSQRASMDELPPEAKTALPRRIK
jgi:mono/diheme cytochrome c family protein